MSMDDFVFVNEDIIVFNKPAGMPSHPLKEGEEKTALAAVACQYPEVITASDNPLEGGLVHRLDNNTSGLLLFARNPDTYALLRELIRTNQIQKTYLAIATGQLLSKLTLNTPIAHHVKNKKKMVLVNKETRRFRGKPQPAMTSVEPVSFAAEATLIHVEIQGGRRHQIRIHLSGAGHPLIGDELYAGPPATFLPGHALHANSITLPNGSKIIAPIPELFRNEAAKYGLVFKEDAANKL